MCGEIWGEIFGFRVRQQNPKPGFQNLNPDFPISPSAESQKFGFMAHSRGTAETCHILIFDY